MKIEFLQATLLKKKQENVLSWKVEKPTLHSLWHFFSWDYFSFSCLKQWAKDGEKKKKKKTHRKINGKNDNLLHRKMSSRRRVVLKWNFPGTFAKKKQVGNHFP